MALLEKLKSDKRGVQINVEAVADPVQNILLGHIRVARVHNRDDARILFLNVPDSCPEHALATTSSITMWRKR